MSNLARIPAAMEMEAEPRLCAVGSAHARPEPVGDPESRRLVQEILDGRRGLWETSREAVPHDSVEWLVRLQAEVRRRMDEIDESIRELRRRPGGFAGEG